MASDIGPQDVSDDSVDFVLLPDETTEPVPHFPPEVVQEILINIRDRDALYSALFVHGFVAISAGVLDEREIVGDHWNLPFIGPGHPHSIDEVYSGPSSSSSSGSSGSSGSSNALRSVPQRNVHTGQILYGYADLYYNLLVNDVKSGALRDFRELGRDIYVRLRGDTTLVHMLDDPGIVRALAGNWSLPLDEFVRSFSKVQYKYSRTWAREVGRAVQRRAQDISLASRIDVPQNVPSYFSRSVSANMERRNFISAYWLVHIAARYVGASRSVDMLVHHMLDYSYVTTANIGMVDVPTEGGGVRRARVSLWTEVVELVDLMLRHNEYVVTNNMKYWMFSVTTVCRLISMSFLERNSPRRGYGIVTRSFAGWDSVCRLLFDGHTNLYNRMMKYLYTPEYGPAGFEMSHAEKEWEISEVEYMLEDANSFSNNAFGIYCVPILIRAILNTEAATATPAPLYYTAAIATIAAETVSMTTLLEANVCVSSDPQQCALGRDIDHAAHNARVMLRSIEPYVAGRSSDELYVQHLYGDDTDDLEDALLMDEDEDEADIDFDATMDLNND